MKRTSTKPATMNTTDAGKTGERNEAMKKPTTTKATRKPARNGYNLSKLAEALNRAEAAPIAISISEGNMKTGRIPAFSLLPGCTCTPEACAHCLREGCYAVKSAFQHGYNYDSNTTLKAWARNTAAARDHLPELEQELNRFFDAMTAPRFFRIHVSGDFFSEVYAKMWFRVIKSHPHTRFLFFTKAWDIMRALPWLELSNLSPVLSGWTGCRVPDDLIRAGYRVAWCDDGIENRIPADAMECPGNCETCGACWNLRAIGRDTYFHKH